MYLLEDSGGINEYYKMTKKIIYFVLAGMALPLASCSLFGPKNEVKEEAVLPQDRESIAVNNDPKQYSPEELRRGIVKGDWAIETVYGKDAVGEKAPFLKFVPDEKRVYGNNGCNVINATYRYNPADSLISFDNLISTMMACGMEGLTDYEINTALGATRRYTWELKDSDYYLHFFDEAGREVMGLMHQNFQFLNGAWLVTGVEGEAVDNPDMKMVIDVDEGKVHGNTGCNIFNGSLEIDMDAANSISFSGIGMTRMACPDVNESAFIVALEEASAARPVSATEVRLYDNSHKEVMRLLRTNPE